MKVYLVIDTGNNSLVCVCGSTWAAQRKLVDYLSNGGEMAYTPDDWSDIAKDNGYDSVEEFKEAIRSCPDYNGDLGMKVRIEDIIE